MKLLNILRKLDKKQKPEESTSYNFECEEDNILACALDIGEEMLASGGEINRVESTIIRICTAYGAGTVDVFAITSMIIATITMPDGRCTTQIKRIYGTEYDLIRLEKLNALSRKICREKIPFSLAAELFDNAKKTESYPAWAIFLGSILAAGGFAVFFGGNIFDGIAAGLLGILLTAIEYYRPSRLNKMAMMFICSFLAGMLSYVLVSIGIGANADKVMIGSIMLLVPGLTFGNALRDLLFGDILSGSIEIVKSFLCAIMIALGYGAAILLMSF